VVGFLEEIQRNCNFADCRRRHLDDVADCCVKERIAVGILSYVRNDWQCQAFQVCLCLCCINLEIHFLDFIVVTR
jgi:hypothetical protein